MVGKLDRSGRPGRAGDEKGSAYGTGNDWVWDGREERAPEGAIGSVTTETTDESRDEAASKLVDRFSLWSGAAGLIPLPIVDIAAVGGVQLEMLRRLSDIYGVPFVENRGKSLIAEPGGIGAPRQHRDNHRDGGDQRAQEHSGIGTAISAFTMPVFSAGATYVDRQGFHPALRFGRNAARLQSAGLSRIHQGPEGEMELPIYGVGCRFSSTIRQLRVRRSTGAAPTIVLTGTSSDRLPSRHAGLGLEQKDGQRRHG